MSDPSSAQQFGSHLSVQLRHKIGSLRIDVAFNITQPWTILFGPSGSGKTTILRAIAGLIRPEFGRIVWHGSAMDRIFLDTEAGIFLPPHLRSSRPAAQGAALFPHMTVRENILFGVRGVSDGTAPGSLADMIIEEFRLKTIAAAMPAMLSGGERQRVAIARAAVSAYSLNDAGILLLDEPFTGLDVRLRDELVGDLQRLFSVVKVPILSVTHDVAEAFRLNAEVIKIADGHVMGQGPVEVVLAEERERLLRQLGETAI